MRNLLSLFRAPLFCGFLAVCLSSVPSVSAQQKYDPDDEVIEKMARAGVRFLEASMANAGGDQLVLAALTICEVSKRYDRVIPKDHPIVQRAIGQILSGLPETTDGDARSGNNLETYPNLYYPALALIVLCDVDDNLYRDQIIRLIDSLDARQQENGAYNYFQQSRRDGTVGDISQTQYACLAYFVAKHHGFRIDAEKLKKTLEWLVANQSQEGSWYYHSRGGRPVGKNSNEKTLTLSRHCCGLGSTYLMSDLLQLNPRMKGNKTRNKSAGRGGLPASVSVYVKPKNESAEESEQAAKTGPLVQFDGSKLANCKRRGNQWFEQNFTIDIPAWNYYYLYGLERYAFFREVAEGEVSEIPDWYDQGVEFLKTLQNESGRFEQGHNALENPSVATCLAVLFLVRSSEVLILPMNSSLLNGGQGFAENIVLKSSRGQIKSQAAVKSIEDVMNLLDEDSTDDQLQLLADTMDDAIKKFARDETMSRAESLAFLTGLVKERNYFKRLIAVKLLARQQSLDTVPALLYALGDPDIRVCKEAQDGLRLISRKIDAFPVSSNPTLDEFKLVKRGWTKWYLKIRPGAELID